MTRAFSIYLYGPDGGPIPSSFEQVAERLQLLDRMYFEMDGSFVWTGECDNERWQLDGVVYDSMGSIQYIDLKGWCPWPNWIHFLAIVGGNPEADGERWIAVRLAPSERQTLDLFHQSIWPDAP
jgi:hypothetical protein